MALICGNCDHEVEPYREVWVPFTELLFPAMGQMVVTKIGFEMLVDGPLGDDGFINLRAAHTTNCTDRVLASTLMARI